MRNSGTPSSVGVETVAKTSRGSASTLPPRPPKAPAVAAPKTSLLLLEQQAVDDQVVVTVPEAGAKDGQVGQFHKLISHTSSEWFQHSTTGTVCLILWTCPTRIT